MEAEYQRLAAGCQVDGEEPPPPLFTTNNAQHVLQWLDAAVDRHAERCGALLRLGALFGAVRGLLGEVPLIGKAVKLAGAVYDLYADAKVRRCANLCRRR